MALIEIKFGYTNLEYKINRPVQNLVFPYTGYFENISTSNNAFFTCSVTLKPVFRESDVLNMSKLYNSLINRNNSFLVYLSDYSFSGTLCTEVIKSPCYLSADIKEGNTEIPIRYDATFSPEDYVCKYNSIYRRRRISPHRICAGMFITVGRELKMVENIVSESSGDSVSEGFDLSTGNQQSGGVEGRNHKVSIFPPLRRNYALGSEVYYEKSCGVFKLIGDASFIVNSDNTSTIKFNCIEDLNWYASNE